jgi:hypothetical protein
MFVTGSVPKFGTRTKIPSLTNRWRCSQKSEVIPLRTKLAQTMLWERILPKKSPFRLTDFQHSKTSTQAQKTIALLAFAVARPRFPPQSRCPQTRRTRAERGMAMPEAPSCPWIVLAAAEARLCPHAASVLGSTDCMETGCSSTCRVPLLPVD